MLLSIIGFAAAAPCQLEGHIDHTFAQPSPAFYGFSLEKQASCTHNPTIKITKVEQKLIDETFEEVEAQTIFNNPSVRPKAMFADDINGETLRIHFEFTNAAGCEHPPEAVGEVQN